MPDHHHIINTHQIISDTCRAVAQWHKLAVSEADRVLAGDRRNSCALVCAAW